MRGVRTGNTSWIKKTSWKASEAMQLLQLLHLRLGGVVEQKRRLEDGVWLGRVIAANLSQMREVWVWVWVVGLEMAGTFSWDDDDGWGFLE
jgi:hypothetical protein